MLEWFGEWGTKYTSKSALISKKYKNSILSYNENPGDKAGSVSRQ